MSGEFPERPGGLLSGFSAGARVAGYRLEEQVGAGGMAVVFRAVDERLGRRVALKILAPALASDEAFRHRFIRESRAAAAVDDPHIIPVHEAGEADGVLFIAMRYVPGRDVRALLYREGPLPPGRAAAIISPVASALDAAHAAGLVHRDVKPANMLLDVRPGRPDHVYLSDFGLSKGALSSVGLTGTGQVLGTPGYISPEQIEGKPADGRADQYALACAAFEMLTGEAPFQRDDPAAVIWAHLSAPPPRLTSRRPDLAAAADQVLARALAKDPAERYAHCADFAEALREALGLPPYDSSPGVIPQPDKPAADHPVTQAAWPAEAAASHATVTITGARAGGRPAPAARDVGAGDGAAGSEVLGAGEPTARPAPPKSIVHAVRIMYAGAALPVILVVALLLIALAGK
ncbi:serine/threonine-protein kinase [Trebonia sp.]|uniref:serine/threonine-protein kinase n=1 Tax=Trebonia sp. TaxID=2767075 RepID=UPI00261456EC|nr:serine/threonine-protein kinase [Trebonia sp.]